MKFDMRHRRKQKTKTDRHRAAAEERKKYCPPFGVAYRDGPLRAHTSPKIACGSSVGDAPHRLVSRLSYLWIHSSNGLVCDSKVASLLCVPTHVPKMSTPLLSTSHKIECSRGKLRFCFEPRAAGVSKDFQVLH